MQIIDVYRTMRAVAPLERRADQLSKLDPPAWFGARAAQTEARRVLGDAASDAEQAALLLGQLGSSRAIVDAVSGAAQTLRSTPPKARALTGSAVVLSEAIRDVRASVEAGSAAGPLRDIRQIVSKSNEALTREDMRRIEQIEQLPVGERPDGMPLGADVGFAGVERSSRSEWYKAMAPLRQWAAAEEIVSDVGATPQSVLGRIERFLSYPELAPEDLDLFPDVRQLPQHLRPLAPAQEFHDLVSGQLEAMLTKSGDLTPSDMRRLAAIEILPEHLRPSFPTPVANSFQRLARGGWLGTTHRSFDNELSHLRDHRAARAPQLELDGSPRSLLARFWDLVADPVARRDIPAFRNGIIDELRRVMAKADDEISADDLDLLARIEHLPDEVRPDLPQPRAYRFSAQRGSPFHGTWDRDSAIASLRRWTTAQAIVADPTASPASVLGHIEQLVSRADATVEDLDRMPDLKLLPAGLRPTSAPESFHQAIDAQVQTIAAKQIKELTRVDISRLAMVASLPAELRPSWAAAPNVNFEAIARGWKVPLSRGSAVAPDLQHWMWSRDATRFSERVRSGEIPQGAELAVAIAGGQPFLAAAGIDVVDLIPGTVSQLKAASSSKDWTATIALLGRTQELLNMVDTATGSDAAIVVAQARSQVAASYPLYKLFPDFGAIGQAAGELELLRELMLDDALRARAPVVAPLRQGLVTW